MIGNRAPAEVGDPISEIDTPALIVDLDALEANIAQMAEALEVGGTRLRPHSKSHKCPAIARMQIAAGAVGVCCQKVSEAEAMIDGGIENVLITNQIVGRRKLNRLAALCRRASVSVCVDDTENIYELNAAAERFNTTIPVLVEIDVGGHRCGVMPGIEAVALAQIIADGKNLRFAGLQAYQGKAQHFRTYKERQQSINSSVESVRETVELLNSNNLVCQIVGGGGTGTYEFEARSGVYNEIQAGSYIFLDFDYNRNMDADGNPISEFENSLFVLTTVMSRAVSGQVVLDAGLKAFSVDSGLPSPVDFTDLEFTGVSDEHSVLGISSIADGPSYGEKIRLIPGHCDPTVNLYSWLVGVRSDVVECLWPVSAQGAGA